MPFDELTKRFLAAFLVLHTEILYTILYAEGTKQDKTAATAQGDSDVSTGIGQDAITEGMSETNKARTKEWMERSQTFL